MKWLFVSALGLMMVFALGGQVSAQVQITTSGINYASLTMHVSPIDQEHWVATGDQLGIRIDDTGKGLFNMLSTDIQFTFYGDKNGMRYHGFETHTDKDGDKVIWDMWDMGPGSNKGRGKIIGATGKFAGAEGTMDFDLLNPPKGFPEGTFRTVCHEHMNITLKNPL
jgi:hypothetical protein